MYGERLGACFPRKKDLKILNQFPVMSSEPALILLDMPLTQLNTMDLYYAYLTTLRYNSK